MTFWGFLILGIVLTILLVLLTFNYKSKGKELFDNVISVKIVFFISFILLAGSAVWTLNTYLYPKDMKTYTNADYHFLEHLGFSFDKKLNLVSYNPPEGRPQKSFWDNKSGMVDLSRDSASNNFILKSADFYEPLYVSKKINDSNFFVITNNLINADVSEGFELKRSDSLIFKMEIIPQYYNEFWERDKIEKVYYISHYNSDTDTSSFDKYISQGYPLVDILQRTPNLNLSDDLLNMLEGAYFIRKNIHIDDWRSARFSKKINNSPLFLFPKEDFFAEDNLNVNDVAIDDSLRKKEFTDTLQSDFRFFAGIGLFQTDIFKVDTADTMQGITMKYILPKMQYLVKDTANINNVFITSSIKEISDSVSRTGYLYNIFENDSNFFNFSGKMRYFVGSPRDSIYFEVRDLKSADGLDSILKTSNEQFSFSSQSGNFNNFKWLFKIEDMRSINSLKWEHIFLFIIIFTCLVVIRLLIFSEKISAIELSIYFASLCFGIIRLILTWRMSTFLPTEGIDPSRFFKMQNGWEEAKWTFSILCLPILFTILGYWHILQQKYKFFAKIKMPEINIQNKFSILKYKFFTDYWYIVALYAALLSVCFFLSKIVFPRFMNILIPITLFFVLYNFVENNRNEALKTIQRILLCFLTFVYLSFQDAGFAIIFLLYLTIHFGIVSLWLKEDIRVLWKIIASAIVIFLIISFLIFEGNLILLVFKNTNIFVFVLALPFLTLTIYAKVKGFSQIGKSLNSFIYISSFIVVIFLAVFGGIFGNDYLNDNKSYIKYRAEVQVDSIANVIQNNEFNSNDIEYIMRSAHNQWFVNEYNAAAKNNNGHWTIQPHFNQGSSYTTQTTDLVVVRYILAEHGIWTLILLMAFLFLLLCVYTFDINIKYNPKSFIVLGVFILMFAIALFVCLSANNKIVFFGQDFPFLSLTSKMALLFPIVLFILAVWQRIFGEKSDSVHSIDEIKNKIGLIVSIFILAVLSALMPSKNESKDKGDNEGKFDISSVINETKDKINDLDRKLQKFQEKKHDSAIEKIDADSIFKEFTESKEWMEELDASKKDFYNSLLNHFANKAPNKYDPNELLHLRRRNGYLHLAVNQKYYTIKSFRQKDLQWTGDLLAAKSDKDFSWTMNGKKNIDNAKDDIVLDVLNEQLSSNNRAKISNLTLRRFDSSWTDSNIPLYLISANGEKNLTQCYDILSENYSKKCSKNQLLSVRLLPNDILSLKRKEKRKESLIAVTKYEENNNNYLAKNMWLNGNKRLFYPLGNISFWTYHFANLINQTYGKEENKLFKDSTIRISIDYDLTKKLHSIIDNSNSNKYEISKKTEKRLLDFKELTFDKQKDSNNTSALYYNFMDKKIHIQSKVSEDKNLQRAVKVLNKNIQSNKMEFNEISVKINEAIDVTLDKLYDYSAVVLDGNGRIRALFDYSSLNKPDPNNIRSFNKLLSDLYKESSISSEIDYFGNKTLNLLVPGPASSFKPIAYTAVTSKAEIDWMNLELNEQQPNVSPKESKDIKACNGKKCITHYGGIEARDPDKDSKPYWVLENNDGFKARNYLIKSDNLYHSLVILLGNQQNLSKDLLKVGKLFKESENSATSYPTIKYRGRKVAFDKNKWSNENNLNPTTGTMDRPLNKGLNENFHLKLDFVSDNILYNAFSDTILSEKYLSILYEQGIKYNNFIWTYPTTGSMNNANRNEKPFIQNILMQMSLGAAPLEVSPLQMATFGMRLASLNSYENITTLSDDVDSAIFENKYKFFNIDTTWGDSTKYIRFHRKNVFGQLGKVLTIGTARTLAPLARELKKEGYYIYAKTGTLNITDKGTERLKHLLVIISNKEMENIKTVEELKAVKYYVLYLSYYGINTNEYSPKKNEEVIKAIVSSEQFKKYMKK